MDADFLPTSVPFSRVLRPLCRLRVGSAHVWLVCLVGWVASIVLPKRLLGCDEGEYFSSLLKAGAPLPGSPTLRAAPPPAENVAASGQPFTKRGQAAHAATPPQLRQTAVDTQRQFSGKAGQRPALQTNPETDQRSPIPPAPSQREGERVALCRQGCRACGLRPFFLPPAVSVGSFQGHQGFASPRSSPVRCSPVPGCAPRAASGRALDTLSTPTAKHAIRKRPSSPQGPFPGLGIWGSTTPEPL